MKGLQLLTVDRPEDTQIFPLKFQLALCKSNKAYNSGRTFCFNSDIYFSCMWMRTRFGAERGVIGRDWVWGVRLWVCPPITRVRITCYQRVNKHYKIINVFTFLAVPVKLPVYGFRHLYSCAVCQFSGLFNVRDVVSWMRYDAQVCVMRLQWWVAEYAVVFDRCWVWIPYWDLYDFIHYIVMNVWMEQYIGDNVFLPSTGSLVTAFESLHLQYTLHGSQQNALNFFINVCVTLHYITLHYTKFLHISVYEWWSLENTDHIS